MRQLSRGTLHIADEPEIQEENNTSTDDGGKVIQTIRNHLPMGQRGVVGK